MTEFFYPSNGAGRIHACVWPPEGKPCAIVQILHGVSEHITRYDAFARYLNAHGILVVGADHMGHGGSICHACPRGHFVGGWDAAVSDAYTLFARTRKTHPGLPYFLLGHSMGSFLARTFLFRYPYSGLRGAVLLGTRWQSGASLQAAQMLCAAMVRAMGPEAVSRLGQRLLLGAFDAPLADGGTDFDWVNSDKAALQSYLDDPLCGFPITNALAYDMVTGLRQVQSRRNLSRMIKTLPVLFASGDHDPVGGMGHGVLNACRAFERTGMRRVQAKLYPGDHHEILHEVDHAVVYYDILTWIIENMGNFAG